MLWWRWSAAALLLFAFGAGGVWVGSTFLGDTQTVVITVPATPNTTVDNSVSGAPWVATQPSVYPPMGTAASAEASLASVVPNQNTVVLSAPPPTPSTSAIGTAAASKKAFPEMESEAMAVHATTPDGLNTESGNSRSIASLAGLMGSSTSSENVSMAASSESVDAVDPELNSKTSATTSPNLTLRSANLPAKSVWGSDKNLETPVKREQAILEYEQAIDDELGLIALKIQRRSAWKNAPRWTVGGYYDIGSTNACLDGFATGPFDHYYNSNYRISNVSETGSSASPHTVNGYGAELRYRLNRRWVVGTGFGTEYWDGWAQTVTEKESETVVRDSIRIEASIIGGSGGGFGGIYQYFNDTSYSYSYDTTQIKYHAQWLEVPLTLQYNVWDRRVRYYVGTGVTASLLWKLQSNATYSTNEISRQMENRVYGGAELHQLNLLLSAGVEIPLWQQNLSFRFEPMLRHGVYVPEKSILQKSATTVSARMGLNLHF